MRLLPDLEEVNFVEVGDFTGQAIKKAVENSLERCFFVGMAGKISKLAAGVMMTHWTRSKVDNELLAEVTANAGGPTALIEEVKNANTARHAYELWRAAGLEKLPGGLWHAYRRKWACERKHFPLVDVAAAGGWTDTATLVACYTQPDADTMRRVMNEPKRLR